MSIANLAAALTKAQAEIEGAAKDRLNPHFKSKYADLSSVMDAIKPALAKHGLAFVQVSHDRDHAAAVETVIVHSSGETMNCGIVSVPVSKGDAQGFGSALTYARRYSLSAAFGVAPEDDDGNAAAAAKPANTATEVMGDAFRALEPDEQTLATDWANQAEKLAQHSISDAYQDITENLATIEDHETRENWKCAVSYKLSSKTRNALKAYGQTLRKAA